MSGRPTALLTGRDWLHSHSTVTLGGDFSPTARRLAALGGSPRRLESNMFSTALPPPSSPPVDSTDPKQQWIHELSDLRQELCTARSDNEALRCTVRDLQAEFEKDHFSHRKDVEESAAAFSQLKQSVERERGERCQALKAVQEDIAEQLLRVRQQQQQQQQQQQRLEADTSMSMRLDSRCDEFRSALDKESAALVQKLDALEQSLEKEVRDRRASFQELAKNIEGKALRTELEKMMNKIDDAAGKSSVAASITQVEDLRKHIERESSQWATVTQIDGLRAKHAELVEILGQKANQTEVQAGLQAGLQAYKQTTIDPRLEESVLQAGLKVEDLRKRFETKEVELSQLSRTVAQLDTLRANHTELAGLVAQKANHSDVQANLKSFMDSRLEEFTLQANQANLKVDDVRKQFDRELTQIIAKLDSLRAKHADLAGVVGQKANSSDVQANLNMMMAPINDNFTDLYASHAELKNNLKEYSDAAADSFDRVDSDIKKMLNALEQNMLKDLDDERKRNENVHKTFFERDLELDKQIEKVERQLRQLIMDCIVQSSRAAGQEPPVMLTNSPHVLFPESPGSLMRSRLA